MAKARFNKQEQALLRVLKPKWGTQIFAPSHTAAALDLAQKGYLSEYNRRQDGKISAKLTQKGMRAVRSHQKKTKNPADPIKVKISQDDKGNPIVQLRSKRDEKRVAAELAKENVGVYVDDEQQLQFLDLAMPDNPVLSSAIYGGLGSVVGMIPGVLIGSPVAIWLGWATGGALGARAGATPDRKDRATWGGAIGGGLGGPIGAALGGAIGSSKRDKNTKALKNKLLR